MNTKRLWLGRIAVLALLLSSLLSIPVLADAGLTAWQGRKIESGIAYEQYQQALEQMERDIQRAVPNELVKKVLLVPIPPGPDSLELYEQYQWALRQMEYDIQNASENPNLGGKPLSIQIRPGNADVFQQYLNALEQMESDIQKAVPNE